MKLQKVFAGALLLLLTVGFASAETLSLTLDQAIELGLENSLAVRSRKNALESARASLAGTKASIYPSLSASAGWMHLFEQPEIPTIPQDPVSVSVDVGQTAIQELRSLCELSGPYEALAYAHAVFEGLSDLVEGNSTYKADGVSPFQSVRSEYRASAHRWASLKMGRIL